MWRQLMDLRKDSEGLKKLLEESQTTEKEKIRALYIVSLGHSIGDVAEMFCVDEQTIYNWITKWREDKNLSNEPKSGRPPSFTEEEKKELRKLVEENDPKEHGINASFWDCAELREYYLKEGKKVSEETIRIVLKEMGAHYVKAQHEYSEADYEKQKEFALQFLKDSQKLTEDIALLVEDEMSACTSPHKGYGWTFRQRLIIKSPQTHKERLNVFGATNPIEGKRIEMTSTIAKAPAFIKFLDKTYQVYSNKKEIWLYIDNGPVHKSILVKEWLDKHLRMKLKRFPPYSPDLNPQELVWGYDRKKFLNNHVFENARQLSMSLHWFVRKLKPDVVKGVCSLIPIEALLSFQV